MATMTIKISDETKARMEAVEEVDWSSIAEAAFRRHLDQRRDSTDPARIRAEIQDVLAAESPPPDGDGPRGHKAGREWALSHAGHDELDRLSAFP